MGGRIAANQSTGPAYGAGLNAEQVRAVEFGLREASRPLIVLAGPGTGKTLVITHRIARLVQAGAFGVERVPPESILAVTFTVNAAAQMRERLAGLTGPAIAERVSVHTFHGLGRVLLQRFGDMLGVNWARVQIIDSAQRTRLMLELMERDAIFVDRIAEGRRALTPAAEGSISACRDRALFPADCLRHAEKWAAQCRANARGLEKEALAAESERAREFSERSRLYAAYDAACHERHWMTFDDLIMQPIRLLREHAGVAAIVRDEWRHVVVDEFQDVNPAQIELLRLLSPPVARPFQAVSGSGDLGLDSPSHGGRDLCVVGDDDQAIYGFRGASERAFADFAALWPSHETVPLKQSYRSTQEVLDVANAVIARAASRFRPDKRIEMAEGSKASKLKGSAEGVVLEEDDHAGSAIAAMIRADGAGTAEKPWGSYAVIVRSNTDMDRIGSDLEVEGVPVRYIRAVDALADDTIRDLLAWIDVIVDPGARFAAQRLLLRPPMPVAIDTVSAWGRSHRAMSRGGHDHADGAPTESETGEEAGVTGQPFVEWLAAQKPEEAGARRLIRLHAELSAIALREPAGRAVMAIIERAGLAHPPIEGGRADGARDHAARIARLVRFLSFVRSREPRLEEPGGLAEFREYFNDLDDNDRSALGTDEDARLEEPVEDNAVEGERGAVSVMTAHKAKGLEFETVFVAKVRPRGFPTSRREEGPELVPASLRPAWASADPGEGEARRADEERRLFYVACTRAARRLVLLAKKKKTRGEATDYFIELTKDAPPGQTLVVERAEADVMSAPGADGGMAARPDAIDGAGEGGTPAQRVGSRLVRGVRAKLAELAGEAEADGLTREVAAALDAEAAGAMSRLAVASHVSRHGRVPAWAVEDGSTVREYAAAIAPRLTGEKAGEARPVLKRMTAPLSLTYSKIDSYHRCPRCFYLKEVLGLEDDRGEPALVGEAAHAALEKFYLQFRDADVGEAQRPTLGTLLALGRAEFEARWPRSRPLDRAQREQLLAQLTLAHERLHSDSLHVLEVERQHAFAYEHGGVMHTMRARIDRVDLGADGCPVIIDYKSGKAWKSLLEPHSDDLQMGIYAMALPSLLAQADGSAAGVELRGRAEYWLLGLGQRSVIDLAALDMGKVRAKIGKAIDGMLAGEYPRTRTCEGPCRVLDPEG